MYRLNHITLHNFCQHKDFEADLQIGLTALCGPNGAGKSTCIRAIAYALTGLVDGDWGSQTQLQKDGSVDTGYAELQFSGPDGMYTIRRYTTSDVKFADVLSLTNASGTSEVAKRRKAVDAALEAMLGIKLSVLFQICWGRQGRLDSLLTATPAVIGQFLSSMFDMTRLEKLRNVLKQKIATIATPPESVKDDLNSVIHRINELPEPGVLECERDTVLERFNEIDENVKQLESVMHCAMPQASRDHEIHSLEEQLESLTESIKIFPMISEAQALEEEDKILVRMQELEESKNKIQDEFRSWAIKKDCLTINKFNKNKSLQELNSQIVKAKNELSGLPKNCPYCGSVIQDYTIIKENKEKELKKLESSYVAINNELEQITADIAFYNANDPSIEPLKNIQNDYIYLMSQRQVAHKNVQLARDRLVVECRISSIKEKIEDLKSVPIVSENDIKNFNDLNRIRSELDAEIAELNSRIVKSNTEREMLTDQKQLLNEYVEQIEISTNVINTLSDLRTMFDQDHVQAVYLKNKIGALNKIIAGYMTAVQMPFTFCLNPDTRQFEFMNDGFVHPAVHLSGAQKSISAVVLQMAILTVVSPNMNLFLIDEPAEALDEGNKIIMASLFERIIKLLPAMDGVMILITRDRQLIDCCDSVIELRS